MSIALWYQTFSGEGYLHIYDFLTPEGTVRWLLLLETEMKSLVT